MKTTTTNPLASSPDRSITFDFDLIRQRELEAQASGARPGTTEHPEEGQAVARVKRCRRYRNAALGAPRTVSVGALAPVKLDVVGGVELGAWIGSDAKVYVAAAEVDREEFPEPAGVDPPEYFARRQSPGLGVDDICDECDQRHGPGDEECDGQDAEDTSL